MMAAEDIRTVTVRIEGRVQGVYYRAWTEQNARALGLDGWVRNLRSGEVEALISGTDDAVEQMIASCRRGPPIARVTDIEISPSAPPPESGFRRLPSA